MPIVMVEEESTFPPAVSFVDQLGAAVTPTAATWSLYDPDANIVNGRLDQVITPLASTVTVVLDGADTGLNEALNGRDRYLVIKAIYNSTLGVGKKLNSSLHFRIHALVGD